MRPVLGIRIRVSLVFVVVLLIIGCSARGHHDPRLSSLESLRVAVQTSLQHRDREGFASLVCWKGADAYSRQEFEKQYSSLFAVPPDSVTIHRGWNAPFVEFITPEGHRYQRNLDPVSYVVVCTGRMRTWLMAGSQDENYQLSWWAHTEDVPHAGQDPILKSKGFSRAERDSLKRYYAGDITEWSLAGRSIQYLGHPHATVQLRGQRLLLLFLEDALAAEKTWPDEGSYAIVRRRNNRPRALREQIGERLSSASLAIVPVARFFLNRETDPELQPLGVDMLKHTLGTEVDSLLADLIANPRSNTKITVHALQMAAARHLRVAPGEIRDMLAYPPLARAARSLWDSLDYEPGVVPEEQVPPGMLATFMSRLDTLVVPRIPAKANLALFSPQEFEWIPNWDFRFVWICPGDTVMTACDLDLTRTWMLSDSVHTVWGGIPLKTALLPLTTAETIESAGKRNTRSNLEGLLILKWLYDRGDEAAAENVFQALLRESGSEASLLSQATESFAPLVGQEMRSAYVERRFKAALDLAHIIVNRYPNTSVVWQARRLMTELPQRTEDFNSFRLPTVSEWRELRASLSREQQIEFFCRRFRLVNWYSLRENRWTSSSAWDDQYREPRKIVETDGWKLGDGVTRVMNPLTALLSDESSGGLGLRIKELPLVAPYLLEDWLTVGVAYDAIERTPELLASVINQVANEPICKIYDWDELTKEQKESRVREIARWAKRYAEVSGDDRLKEKFRSAKTYQGAWNAFISLSKESKNDMLPVYLSFLDKDGLSPFDRASILNTGLETSPSGTLKHARKYLANTREPGVQMVSGIIVSEAGYPVEGRAAIALALRNGTRESISSDVLYRGVKILLDSGSLSDYEAARAVFDRSYFNWYEGQGVLLAFMKSGKPDAYSWFLANLDDTSTAYTIVKGHRQTISVQQRDRIARTLVELARDLPSPDSLEYDLESSPEIKAANRKRLKAWLTTKLDASLRH